jgi:hypothetical protein
MAKGSRANTVHHGALFSVDSSGTGLEMTPGSTFSDRDLIAIDRAIRHLPCVVKTLEAKAKEVLAQVGSEDFEIVMSTKGRDRPRFFVCPRTSAGVHAELSKSVLTLASLSMKGH